MEVRRLLTHEDAGRRLAVFRGAKSLETFLNDGGVFAMVVGVHLNVRRADVHFAAAVLYDHHKATSGLVVLESGLKSIFAGLGLGDCWFSCLLRHLARKRSGSILSTPEPARGSQSRKCSAEFQLIISAQHVWTLYTSREENTECFF